MKSIGQIIHHKTFSLRILDSKGNELYYEDSDGDWMKNEYDDKGNETSYDDSDGYWSKYEYDDLGNLVWYKNSNSCIIDYNRQ